jgi:hypothetical protein
MASANALWPLQLRLFLQNIHLPAVAVAWQAFPGLVFSFSLYHCQPASFVSRHQGAAKAPRQHGGMYFRMVNTFL